MPRSTTSELSFFLAASIGVACYLAAFLAALMLDQPFGPVLVLVLIAAALAASAAHRARQLTRAA